MFFYMYAFIELLAFFLDSGVIPSAHVSYPVRHLVFFLNGVCLMLNAPFLPVVRRGLYRICGISIHLSAYQWFRWIPVCRGRDTVIVMGTRLILVELTLRLI